MRGPSVGVAARLLARQLAAVAEARREAQRDRCRRHFVHGGQVGRRHGARTR